MPFPVSSQQSSFPLNNGNINPLPSTDALPEIRLWEQVRTFFDPIQEPDVLAYIRNIVRPPPDTTREEVAKRFELLRALAYPGHKENIQSNRYGENHFCILGKHGEEILSVTLDDTKACTVEYGEGRIRCPFIRDQQAGENVARNTPEAPSLATPLTAEEYEAIWSEWNSAVYYCGNQKYEHNISPSEKSTRDLVVKQLRHCLKNGGIFELERLGSLTSLPKVLPPNITGLTLINIPRLHLPPLPSGLNQLSVWQTPLFGLPELPPGLQKLDISEVTFTDLPPLPPALQTLKLDDIEITHLLPLPPALRKLKLVYLSLTHLPLLPPTLKKLHLNTLPLTVQSLSPLPSGLNKLTLKSLELLTSLPKLPPGIKELTLDELPLTSLPEWPRELQILKLMDMPFSHLPALPPTLNHLHISGFPLAHLPPLPPALLKLDIHDVPLISGIEYIVNLSSAAQVKISGSTMSERMIQTLDHLTREPDYSGPRIYFERTDPFHPREARLLSHAVADWFTSAEAAAVYDDKWKTFEQESHSSFFSLFLDRLSDTECFKQNSEFKAQVSSWLTLLTEDDELRARSFTMAMESTSSSANRITQVMNQMKLAQLVHRAEKGLFDTHIPGLVAAGREMFRLEKLEQIAQEKTKTLKVADEIEIWLGYQSRLKESLELTSMTAEIHNINASGITESDLQAAENRVKTAEKSQFATWILQWPPLHSLLQRTEPTHWEALTEKKKSDDENRYQTLYDTELKPTGNDTEAERTLGTRAIARAETAFLEGLRELTEKKLAGYL